MSEGLQLDDTQEMPAISPWDDDLSSFRLLPRRIAGRILDQAAFARIQERSVIAMVDAWVMAAVIGPDEPVPYYLTPMGEAVPCPEDLSTVAS